jgi:predicted nucleic acid-binding protein
MIVADTDVLIDFLADHDPGASRVAAELERGHLATTVITRFELLSGARTNKQERTLRDFLDTLPALALSQAAADRAATVKRLLERQGRPIGMADSLIAGIVLAAAGTLLTRNVHHFRRVPDLILGDLGE